MAHAPPDNALKHPRLTVEETMAHPSFPTTVWRLQPTREGKLKVADGRGGPFDLSWEVHGKGETKLVWIAGLGAIKSAWQRQTLKFGHENADKYSSLVFDNRGMGASGKPLMRYSTSEMAKDIIELLDHLGWTHERELHVVGVSMGGMIAQELAYLIPSRICSLSLFSTVARLERTVPFIQNLRNRINMFIPKSLDQSVRDAAWNLFPDTWLDLPDTTHLPTRATPSCLPPATAASWDAGGYGLFPTNFARFAAQELTKRLDAEAFGRRGFVLQAVAAGWHCMGPERLRELGDRVGRERIAVVHGTQDRMLTFQHGETIRRELQPGEWYVREGGGHVLTMEATEWHDQMVERLWTRTAGLGK